MITTKKCLLLLGIIFQAITSFSQSKIIGKIDSLLSLHTNTPFNGVILVSDDKKAIYSKALGFSNFTHSTSLKIDDQFVVGSISKQFTATLVLQEYEKRRINLSIPIRRYLPELTQSWADTVTVHHLLSHTHGIVTLEKPTMFKVGAQFAYSQIGYDLLAKIIERTSGKSFSSLATELFKQCKMSRTFHPDVMEYHHLAKGYTQQPDGTMAFDSSSFMNYPAAGSFVSTAGDLALWNECLHNGKLLKPNTYQMMITPQKNAVREHPIFGKTYYGYGITVLNTGKLTRLGQTGFTPGFVSMDFYYPETHTTVVVWENVVYDNDNLVNAFKYHTEILQIAEMNLKN